MVPAAFVQVTTCQKASPILASLPSLCLALSHIHTQTAGKRGRMQGCRLGIKTAVREEFACLSFYNCCCGHWFRHQLWILLSFTSRRPQCDFHTFTSSISLVPQYRKKACLRSARSSLKGIV